MVLQHVAVRDGNTGHEGRAQSKPAPTAAEKSNTLRDDLQRIYRAEIGVRELSGKNDGKRVEEYLAVTNLGKGHAWCSSFISWSFAQVGFEEPNTPWSPALFPKERVIWEKGKPNTSYLKPATADIFGIWFPRLGRIAHAGFVDEWGRSFIITVEGNTNEAGSAEGDGVYRRRRPIGSIHSVANWVDRP
jgi:hypothetical protein